MRHRAAGWRHRRGGFLQADSIASTGNQSASIAGIRLELEPNALKRLESLSTHLRRVILRLDLLT
jgi:hypothetical protein